MIPEVLAAAGVGFVSATVILHAVGLGLGVLVQRTVVTRAAGGVIAASGLVLLVAS